MTEIIDGYIHFSEGSSNVQYVYLENKEFSSLDQLKYALKHMGKAEILAKLQINIDKGYKLIKPYDNSEI